MNGRTIQLILVATLVAIAGCAGGMGGGLRTDSADDSSVTDSSAGTGTAAFYVSDEPNAIDDFEHLNVTITEVGFKKGGELSDGSDGDAETESEADDAENETDGEREERTEGDQKADDERDEEGDEWTEYDVDERTVDLTELKGSNASMIDEFELPAGDYETVFIYVSDTEGVLTDGSTTRVKLPSSKLQLDRKFTIGDNESVDFVYDIAPHKAGKSGKYILKPVISQSGTGDDVEIDDVGEETKDEDDEKGDGDGDGTGEAKADSRDD
ncbi:DUF4382 domain-containing protein [Natrinema longum]|uniref:DUF4382 domain-containing protein n=1 Tax=Natrinema longum TaxID=370324 RepID=A0A8A2U767_9EURY|nr:DUF4382 domain-containing protein [Natrinema longum]MBZ6494924.1 DUF4382 domain-containing protein [Natrinema longum]QSW83778.1 DUF4382 domain-containing protein [Natrinema longum]